MSVTFLSQKWHTSKSQPNEVRSSQKLSAYFRIGHLSWLIMFLRVDLWPCTHNACKRACYFCSFSATSLSFFCHFKPFPLENVKWRPHSRCVLAWHNYLVSWVCLLFSEEVNQNGQNGSKFWPKYHFLHLVPKKCNLEKKSENIFFAGRQERDTTFLFHACFSFSVVSPPKWLKLVQNVQNTIFSYPKVASSGITNVCLSVLSCLSVFVIYQ